jgi:histidine triad (HIT) family protein
MGRGGDRNQEELHHVTAPVSEFCRMASTVTDAPQIVSEGQDWLAFLALEPAVPGHTLVIPRAHVIDLWDADRELAAHLTRAAIQVGRAIDAALEPDGMNLITSSGAAAEQTVSHLHLHVVPRWSTDGFGRLWPTEHTYESDCLSDIAARIRDACPDSAQV